MQELLSGLNLLGRTELKSEIEKIHDLSVLEYSQSIYSYPPDLEMESALKDSFRIELERVGYTSDEIEKIIQNLQKSRVIQTGPHLVFCYGPRMLVLDWQASLGIQPNNHYVVGMYSGIPFSNNFLPGHLSYNAELKLTDVLSKDTLACKEIEKNQKIYKDDFGLVEKRFSIIPSRMQDELVFRSNVPDKTREMVASMTPKIRECLDRPSLYKNSYTAWAIDCHRNIMSRALRKNNLVYIDINEVISNYLIKTLADQNHLFYKVLFDPVIRGKFCHNFNTEKLFLIPYLSSGFPSQESMKIAGQELVGNYSKLELKPQIIIDALKTKRLCPGLLLTFTTLSFLNGFKCLGSFRQSIYLPEYKQKWMESGLLNKAGIERVPVCNLTTGFFADSELANVRPLDIILGMKYNPDPSLKMSELISSVKNKLLE